MSDDRIYLDHHATTPCDPRVLDVMWPWFAERVGNASSTSHSFGRKAHDAVELARQQIADALRCQPEEIIFTSGATESNNLAIKGVLQGQRQKRHLIINATEHRAVLDPAKRLKREGIDVTILPVDEYGRVDPQSVEKALRPETALVSVMAANNEVGTLNRLDQIGNTCLKQGVLLHSDASQAVGKIPVDLTQLPVDLMSFTAHKLYGPQGVGALFVRRRQPATRINCQIDGGGHERRLRSGTLPVPLIVGFGEACRLAIAEREVESARLSELRDRLHGAITTALNGVTLNGHPEDRLPGNLHLSFPGVDGDALMSNLDGLAVSSGSACTTADPEPSHVLRAMGVPESLSLASLRFGIGRFTTADEIDRAAQIVVTAVLQLVRHHGRQ